MNKKYENIVIGYSGFLLYEECYEYSENACFLAESLDSANLYMEDCGHDKSDFRVDEISLSMLIKNYGHSFGEYAMEKLAFEKFKKIADKEGIKYTFEDFYLDPSMKVVEL